MLTNKSNILPTTSKELNSITLQNVPLVVYLGTFIVFAMYLICVVFHWELFYFLSLFTVIVLITALIKFEAAFLFVPLTLTNPYMLKETGTNLHLSELVLIIIFIVWASRIVMMKERIVFPKNILYSSLTIIVTAILSLLVARYFVVSILQIIRDIEILLVFFMVVLYTLTNEKRIKQVFLFLIIGGLIASCVGLGQFINNASELRQSTRVFGWLGGGYGSVVASTIILSICALVYKGNRMLNILALITLPIAISALIISQTRAWIGALFIVLGLLFFWRNRGAKKKILKMAGFIIFCVIIVTITNISGLIHNRVIMDSIGGAFRFGESQREHSLSDASMFLRLVAWKKAILLYIDHPVFGIGVGNVRFDFSTLKLAKPGEGIGYVDNQYLQGFVEAGTIAGIAWIVYIFQAVGVGIKSVRRSIGSNLYLPAIGFMGCLLIFVLGSFFWVITPDHELFALMVLYIGLLINIYKINSIRGTSQEK
jgi:hypothetical protein